MENMRRGRRKRLLYDVMLGDDFFLASLDHVHGPVEVGALLVAENTIMHLISSLHHRQSTDTFSLNTLCMIQRDGTITTGCSPLCRAPPIKSIEGAACSCMPLHDHWMEIECLLVYLYVCCKIYIVVWRGFTRAVSQLRVA